MPVNNAPPRLNTAQGAAPSYAARAWVNFNGTGTVAIRASGNVSSITDNGTGDYTVNFTTAMTNANYASVKATGLGTQGAFGGTPTTTNYRFSTGFVSTTSGAQTSQDAQEVNFVIFR